MGPQEEQRFDFDVEVTDSVLASASRGRRSPGARERPSNGAGSEVVDAPATDADELTRSLRARIERIREHANGSGGQERGRDAGDEALPESSSEEPEGELDSLSIAEFYARVKRALAGQFPEELWVTGEIRSIRVSNGHRFIELADQGVEGRATQQLEVACWSTQWRSVEASLRSANVELEVGRVIRVFGRVSVWEAASRLRFNLTRIDVEALLGGIAAARQRLLNALEAEGIVGLNATRSVPPVPLRIGLVTSQGSEAQKDFIGRLERSGFAFEVEHVHSLVQGAEAPGQIVQAMERLFRAEPDLVVLVRGGGSRNDLAAFDAEIVARAIANAPCPVWVGIGHTGDNSVADVVANASFITPTACGEAIVARVVAYWTAVTDRIARIGVIGRARLAGAGDGLAQFRSQLERSVLGQIADHESARVDRRARLVSAGSHLVRAQRADLVRRQHLLTRSAAGAQARFAGSIHQRGELLRAFDPERQLARGWAIVRGVDGRVVRLVDDLSIGSKIIVKVHDGELGASIEAIRRTSPPSPGDVEPSSERMDGGCDAEVNRDAEETP